MRRKIYDRLLQWKREKDGTTALMIEGARRVGKSYIAEEFARNEYDSYILIDFSKAPKRVKDWFDEYLEDVDTLLQHVKEKYSAYPINDVDGVRINFDRQRVHLRKSNTEPIIRIYAESGNAADADALAKKIIGDIKSYLSK
jgi:phosphomannomutase